MKYIEENEKDAVNPKQPRSSCLTNGVGPVKFQPCDGGWVGCNRIDLPPVVDERCFRWMSVALEKAAAEPKLAGMHIDILYFNGDLNFTCYKYNFFNDDTTSLSFFAHVRPALVHYMAIMVGVILQSQRLKVIGGTVRGRVQWCKSPWTNW